MEFVGLFLIAVAATLRIVIANTDSQGHKGEPKKTVRVPAMFTVSPGAAVIMVAVSGVFIFAANVGQ